MTIEAKELGLSAELLGSAEVLLSRRKLDEALRTFHRAELKGADSARCACGRWTIHMLRGDFAKAWAESDGIRNSREAGPNCLWRGEAIRGKQVIVRCLHGFGDAVQLFRFAPQLNAIAAKVVWQVAPEMLDIAQYFVGVGEAVSWGKEPAISPEWDAQVECMELPSIFRTRIGELPIVENYLRIPDEVTELVASQMEWSEGLRVGVVWAAGEWNRSRSVPLEVIYPILQLSGCEFWNLQGGPERRRGRALQKCANMRESNSCNNGIVDLAAVIAQLDLIITVDTLAAHLAGALGVPAWVMLQYAADWRWMMHRDDSPWYPSLRLFRQPTPGDWRLVVREVKERLLGWICSGTERLAA